jgi:hypothetical protein
MEGLVAISSSECLKVSDALTCRRAHHEAGHAIASRRLSLSVTKLTLDGATSRMPVTDSGRQRFATVAYGGPIAEARYCRLTSDQCRKLWTDAWQGDRENIERCQLSDAERVKARERAKWLVATHWRKIDALATALAERRELSGDEVRAVLNNVYFF